MADRVLGILGGRDVSDDQLQAWASSATILYAADSGANRLIHLGFSPIVVGDLDSFDQSLKSDHLRIVEDPDPDRTDCDKLLALIASEGYFEATIIGLEGDLLDHVLSSLSSIARSTLKIRIVLRKGIAYVIRAGHEAKVAGALGKRVSLIPLTRSTGVSLKGVLWELTEAVIEPAGFLSVSNEGIGQVEALIRTGTSLLFVEMFSNDNPFW